MKLSLRKRLGYVHVRGGRFLRVIHAHRVPTTTRTVNRHESGLRTFKGTGVEAHPGDLAVEIVAYKSGNVIGYSYLSGDALQLNCYTANAKHFEPIASHRIDFSMPTSPDDADDVIKRFVGGLMNAKYGDTPVCGMEVVAPQDAPEVAKAIINYWQYEPVEDHDPPTTHMFALVRSSNKKATVTMHLQPPKDANDYAATGFQTALVVNAINRSATEAN